MPKPLVMHATEATSTPRQDGDINAVVVRVRDTGDRTSRRSDRYRHEINHGLGRVPVGCQVILSDSPVQVYVVTSDRQKIVVKFTEQRVDVNLRIW